VFCHCKRLERIKFPSTLTEIGVDSFWGCIQLKEVVLNEGLQKIGQFAFAKCKSLESIKFPSTLSEVGKYAFHNCANLLEVGLNEGLQKIGEGAFAYCSSLESFKLPKISMRLKVLPNPVQTEVGNKINEIPDFVLSGGDISISVAAMINGGNWGGHKESLGRIDSLIAYYDLKEAATTFELALWKANIDNNLAGKPVKRAKIDKNKAANIDNRKEYLMEVPGPVKKAVLQHFLQRMRW
ncbi:hypothetical protein ACHAXR_008657, partial [Thalassiosira sp. AJA248-18]